MDTINKLIITGLLTMVFVWGGGTTKAYTPDEAHRTLVHNPQVNIMLALEKL